MDTTDNIVCPHCKSNMTKCVALDSFDISIKCTKCIFTVTPEQRANYTRIYGTLPLQEEINNIYMEILRDIGSLARNTNNKTLNTDITTLSTDAFETIVNATFDECKRILINKGHEYQNTSKANSNVLANFERGAKNIGVRAETVLFIFLSKHIDSISTYIRELQSGKPKSEITAKLTEPIDGRIDDAINYLLLLKGMVKHYKV